LRERPSRNKVADFRRLLEGLAEAAGFGRFLHCPASARFPIDPFRARAAIVGCADKGAAIDVPASIDVNCAAWRGDLGRSNFGRSKAREDAPGLFARFGEA